VSIGESDVGILIVVIRTGDWRGRRPILLSTPVVWNKEVVTHLRVRVFRLLESVFMGVADALLLAGFIPELFDARGSNGAEGGEELGDHDGRRI
jgi:hypothetical protein